MRPPVTLFLLFLVPLVAYVLFVKFRTGRVFERGYWRLKTFMTIAIVGMLLILGNLIYLSHFVGGPPGAAYEPARFEGGKVVPGQIR